MDFALSLKFKPQNFSDILLIMVKWRFKAYLVIILENISANSFYLSSTTISPLKFIRHIYGILCGS